MAMHNHALSFDFSHAKASTKRKVQGVGSLFFITTFFLLCVLCFAGTCGPEATQKVAKASAAKASAASVMVTQPGASGACGVIVLAHFLFVGKKRKSQGVASVLLVARPFRLCGFYVLQVHVIWLRRANIGDWVILGCVPLPKFGGASVSRGGQQRSQVNAFFSRW